MDREAWPAAVHRVTQSWTGLERLIVACCSVAQLCPTLCDPRDCSTPGSPVLHHLPELAQTHVH